ncbi:MAG: Smr/MutS family protein [Myxococcota bacterium]
MASRNDEEEFERAMEGLGVKPAPRPGRNRRGLEAPTVVEDIDFEAAMRELPDGRAARATTPAPVETGTASETPKGEARAAPEEPARYAATAEERAAFLAAVGAVTAPKEGAASPAKVAPFDAEALVRRIRRGQVEPDASLDLHGKNRQQALDQVKRFVAEARAEKWRLVRIVVGKGLHSEGGDAVVGPAVERWLVEGPAIEVLRAPTHLGGAGALLAVLRLE